MTKFLYTYAVIRTDCVTNVDIATGYTDKAHANQLAVAATNNVPGRVFAVKQRRTLNPSYSG